MNLNELRTRLLADELSATTLGDGTGVLVDLAGMTVFTFNETGMFLVQQLTHGTPDVEGLVSAMIRRFAIDRQAATEDVEVFLKGLSSALSRP